MDTHGSYHIGIILDGNGRWAKERGKTRLLGHSAGSKNLNTVVKACVDTGRVTVLSVYAFAIANWKREKSEVEGLWDIFRRFFKTELEEIMKQGVAVRMIGAPEGVPHDVLELIREAEKKSKDNTALLLQIALNYDGVDEVVRATRAITQKVQDGELAVADIDATLLYTHLDTSGIQDPDIIIRTGVEQEDNKKRMTLWRSSSFLQLQSAHAVCVSTSVLWPDFSSEDLEAAIAFAKPDERLFGGQRR
ncbi:MAG: undecaprenyl diphosphate synthase [Candidatus Azotimanducaceae bacterium]|jgi:undecaprenyl diphosphate synthase